MVWTEPERQVKQTGSLLALLICTVLYYHSHSMSVVTCMEIIYYIYIAWLLCSYFVCVFVSEALEIVCS